MRINYSYTKYNHSKSATWWSRLHSGMSAASIFYIFGLFALICQCFMLLSLPDTFILITPILAIIIYIWFIKFCKRKEEECATFDMLKLQLNRNLTKEEKKAIRMNIRNKNKKKN